MMNEAAGPTEKLSKGAMGEFRGFGKIPRFARPVILTEKIDGTNASVLIEPGYADDPSVIASCRILGTDYVMRAGSRTRWVTPKNDNFGFAAWAQLHADEFFELGVGHHFGEWWGKGIQRGYGIEERRFSLFNAGRWIEGEEDRVDEQQRVVPAPFNVVPVVERGACLSMSGVLLAADILRIGGSRAAPGYMNPEGVVVYHEASGHYYKYSLKDDEKPKGRP